MTYKSIYQLVREREQKCMPSALVRSRIKQSPNLVERLTLNHTLTGHRGCVNTILFSDDGFNAYTGSDDTYCNIYDVDSGQLKQTLSTRHTNNIFFVKDLPFSQGNTLVSCAADGRILLTDLNKNSCVQLYSHRGRAHRLSLIPNSPCSFYSCGEDGRCCFFDIRTISNSSFDLTNDISESLSQDPYYRRSRAGSFAVVDDASIAKTIFKNLDNRSSSIYCIHVNPMKHHEVAVAGSSQHIAIYDARKFEKPCSMLCPNHLIQSSEHVTGIKYNYSGNTILASYNDGDVYTIDTTLHSHGETISTVGDNATDGNFSMRYCGHRNHDTVKQVSFFGSRSDWVISGSDCGHIFIWSTETGEVVRMLDGDSIGAVNCFDQHPFLPILASSGLESNGKLWSPLDEYDSMRYKYSESNEMDFSASERLRNCHEVCSRNAKARTRLRLPGSRLSRISMQVLLSNILGLEDSMVRDELVAFFQQRVPDIQSGFNEDHEEWNEDVDDDEGETPDEIEEDESDYDESEVDDGEPGGSDYDNDINSGNNTYVEDICEDNSMSDDDSGDEDDNDNDEEEDVEYEEGEEEDEGDDEDEQEVVYDEEDEKEEDEDEYSGDDRF